LPFLWKIVIFNKTTEPSWQWSYGSRIYNYQASTLTFVRYQWKLTSDK